MRQDPFGNQGGQRQRRGFGGLRLAVSAAFGDAKRLRPAQEIAHHGHFLVSGALG